MRQTKACKGQPWISPIRLCERRHLPALEVVCIWIEVDELQGSCGEDDGEEEEGGNLGFGSAALELKPL